MNFELHITGDTIENVDAKFVMHIDNCLDNFDSHHSPLLAVPQDCHSNEDYMTYLKNNKEAIAVEWIQLYVAADAKPICLICLPEAEVEQRKCIVDMMRQPWFISACQKSMKSK